MWEYVWGGLLLLGVLAGLAWWIRASLLKAVTAREQDQSLLLLQGQLNALTQQTGQQMDQLRQALQQIGQHMGQSLDTTRQRVDQQLQGATTAMQHVHQQLVSLEGRSQQIFEVGKDIAGLQDLLKAPKLRGSLGEYLLGDLLGQVLPPSRFALQYGFKGAQTVDAVIRLEAGLVPVDAKFPLENFKRLVEGSEADQKTARRAFLRDVKIHIEAIASKYIRTDEGTFDFALMYIPAENVYYEIILRDEDPGDDKSLLTHALKHKVIPVSPGSFYAYLQTVLLGLKGLEVEKGAREIMNQLSRLNREFARFEDDFRLVGSHMDNAVKKYGEAEKRLGRIESRMEQMDGQNGAAPPLAEPGAEAVQPD